MPEYVEGLAYGGRSLASGKYRYSCANGDVGRSAPSAVFLEKAIQLEERGRTKESARYLAIALTLEEKGE